MSYRCTLCRHATPPRTPMRKVPTYRDDARKSIAYESAVCPGCFDLLNAGVPVAIIVRQRGVPKVVGAVPDPSGQAAAPKKSPQRNGEPLPPLEVVTPRPVKIGGKNPTPQKHGLGKPKKS